MRKNRFGDRYCHTTEEVVGVLNEAGWEVHVVRVDPPDEHADLGEPAAKWTADVLTNHDGEVACFIEADTAEEVRAMIREAGVECLEAAP